MQPKGGAQDETIIDLGTPGTDVVPITARVYELTVSVKKIVTTDEGKLQVSLESEAMSEDALAQLKDMLVLQQAGRVLVSMEAAQRDLFDS